jgi:hypothetical protein
MITLSRSNRVKQLLNELYLREILLPLLTSIMTMLRNLKRHLMMSCKSHSFYFAFNVNCSFTIKYGNIVNLIHANLIHANLIQQECLNQLQKHPNKTP